MGEELLRRALRQPTAAARLQAVTTSVLERRCCVLLLPATAPAGAIVAALEAELRDAECNVFQVDASAATDQDPATLLCEQLEVSRLATAAATVKQIRECVSWYDTILIAGLDQLGPDGQDRWVGLLALWAAAAPHEGAPGLIVPLTVDETTIERLVAMPGLTIHWWWRTFSTLDAQQICRALGPSDVGQALWHEAVLPPLASGDMALFAWLWTSGLSHGEPLVTGLRALAAERGWTLTQLEAWGTRRVLTPIQLRSVARGAPGQAQATPPPALRALWRAGVLLATPEDGMLLHPAALAVLDQEAAIRQRIWRGQAAVLQPLIDDLRYAICSELAERYGPDWWDFATDRLSEDEREALNESALAVQLGHMEYVLRYHTLVQPHRETWLTRVRQVRLERNKLAHYTALSPAAFFGLLEALRR